MAKTKAIKIKRSPGDQLVQIVIYIFVGAFALITLLPFILWRGPLPRNGN